MAEKKSTVKEDWWTDWQRELVEDDLRIWIKEKFKVTAGYWIIQNGSKILGKLIKGEVLPKGATLDHDAWDHEHCGLCWTKISENNKDQQEGYTDGKEWLCLECYERYIVPRK